MKNKKKKKKNNLGSNQAPRSNWPSTSESTYMYTNGKFKISFLSLKLSLLAASPLVNTPPYCPSVVNLPATLANPWAEISQGNSLTQMLPKELQRGWIYIWRARIVAWENRRISGRRFSQHGEDPEIDLNRHLAAVLYIFPLLPVVTPLWMWRVWTQGSFRK